MKDFRRGITISSLAACLLGLLLMSMLVQLSEVIIGLAYPGEHTLPIPAMIVFLVFVLVVGLVAFVGRFQLLTRGELLCVLFAMLLGAPLMSQAFWHRIIAITATIPRDGDFTKMDLVNDKLWPHGPNLVADGLTQANEGKVMFRGQHAWQEAELAGGVKVTLPVLKNTKKDEVSAVRFVLPLEQDGRRLLALGAPHLISVLLRPGELSADSYYYCRIYNDDEPQYQEVFRDSAPAKRSYLQPTGFLRVGAYGAKFPTAIKSKAVLEFGLIGAGSLELYDPKLFSVEALETAYSGKLIVRESEYQKLSETERVGLLVKPDNMWSWAGLKFTLGGYIPWSDWLQPLLLWTLLIGFILIATFAVNVIMRKQWMESERYSMPAAKIPAALLDVESETERPFAAIWTNKMMWIGFGVTLAWCLMRAWHFFNPKVPRLEVYIPLQPYFAGPEWGGMFGGVDFYITAVFLSIALLMELNVLVSLVTGYFLYRSLMRVGEATGWNLNYGYPFPAHFAVAAYLTYAVLIIIFTRKYLWHVLQAAWRGDRAASVGEVFSYRTAILLLIGTFVGALLWGRWINMSVAGIALYFIFLVVCGIITAKFRAECGAPFGYYAPSNTWLFISLVGGITVFGANGVVVCLMASFMFSETIFFLMTGAQLEFVELGRRLRVTPRHLFYTCIIAIVGGMVLGGWAFLSNSYSLGGDSTKYQWAYGSKSWYFFQFNAALGEENAKLLGETLVEKKGGLIAPETWAYIYAGTGTAIVTILRQMFAGFWFHPFGFILGSSWFMNYVWGSCLTAWVVRGIVLKLGGAATVKNKLVPFAIGMFLASVVAYLLFGVHGAYQMAHNVDKIFGAMP